MVFYWRDNLSRLKNKKESLKWMKERMEKGYVT